MNVLDLLKKNILKEYFFFNDWSGADERERTRKIVAEFLDCEDERHRETLANLITNYTLLPHAKGAEIAPLLDIMNMFELFEQYSYRKNRKHMTHQVYTFLLGLLLYENVAAVREKLDCEIRSTTNLFSSGDEKGEFLFRWRLASLTHDLGNGISLFENDNIKIEKYIFYLQLLSNEQWGGEDEGVEEMLTLVNGKSSLELLDEMAGNDYLVEFYEYLKSHPLKKIYYDHGIMSAVILLKLLDRMYSKYDGRTIEYKGHRVAFNRTFFEKSIVPAAYAMAFHNLDFYPHLISMIWKTTNIYDFNDKPFCWLLKICDILQEWNKPRASDEKGIILPNEIELKLKSSKIIIEKFPRKNELEERFSRFFVAENIVKIK